MTATRTTWNLEERTAVFGEAVINLCKLIPKDLVSTPLINQLVKAATSVGANYCEADDAESRKDFKHKIGICKKEARESAHFLRMLSAAIPSFEDEIELLRREAKELNLIFNSIYIKVNR